MNPEPRAPSGWHVVRAIAGREIGIAARRRMVRLLFLASLAPPLVFGVILVVRMMAAKAGVDLGWDPVLWFLRVQTMPVALLALGLGTPVVARDRAEDVLYLYAVRPVSPWHYAAGKMLSVITPAVLLLFLPGVIIAVLRQGVMPQSVSTLDSLFLVVKVALGALFLGAAFAGVSVGPSAATKRARWALLIAFGFFLVPDILPQVVWGDDAYALGPGNAAGDLLGALFEEETLLRGVLSAAVLAAYAVAGGLITVSRVRQEMTP